MCRIRKRKSFCTPKTDINTDEIYGKIEHFDLLFFGRIMRMESVWTKCRKETRKMMRARERERERERK